MLGSLGAPSRGTDHLPRISVIGQFGASVLHPCTVGQLLFSRHKGNYEVERAEATANAVEHV